MLVREKIQATICFPQTLNLAKFSKVFKLNLKGK
ncbi:hypothetical protein NIES4102_16800 [Chondrocystis sp. NIES-4102]|nr:hypothetical protein NIES4102_16800 [Chondrocystis sp. NIES-4102]